MSYHNNSAQWTTGISVSGKNTHSLLYSMSGNTVTAVFPEKYIQVDTYKSTPKQREEIKAYRDENTRNLTRITAKGMKSKIVFSTRDNLSLDEKIEIQNFFYNAETNHTERKVKIKYWDDENNCYDEGFFYRPNMDFEIKTVSNDTIKYKSFNFELIEY